MCLAELSSAFRSSEPLAHCMAPPYSGQVILSESAPDPHAHCLQRHSQSLSRMHSIVFWVSNTVKSTAKIDADSFDRD